MNFIAEHFWKFVLLILASVGGWFGYDKYTKSEAWNSVVDGYKGEFKDIDNSANAKDENSQRRYWKFLVSLHDFHTAVANGEVLPVPPKDVSDEASEVNTKNAFAWLLTALSTSDSSSSLMMEALRTNYATCEKYGLFSSQTNLNRINRGENPIIENGPYRDEHLVISLRLPIFAAREACHHPANFVILPESIAAIEPTDIDDPTKAFATKLKQASIISQRTMDAVNRLNEQGKR